jgi:glycerate kinase
MKRINKILIMPDSFKGSLTAIESARFIKQGFKQSDPDANMTIIPFSDGGDGFVDALRIALKARVVTKKVCGPLITRRVKARYLLYDDLAIIEMAQAAGINLLKNDTLDPMNATTYGVGELIYDAVIKQHKKTIVLGLGGSATVDAGAGILHALGVQFVDSNNQIIQPTGGNLGAIRSFYFADNFQKFKNITFIFASDVTNPLLGKNGAARIFAPQKGASASDVVILEKNLRFFEDMLNRHTGRNVTSFEGSGAAGGIASGLAAFFDHWSMRSGAQVFFDLTGISAIIKNFDLVITGEGRLDAQSLNGKAVFAINQLAKQNGCRVVAICGSLGAGYEGLYSHGIDYITSIIDAPMTLDQAIGNARMLLTNASFGIARLMG